MTETSNLNKTLTLEGWINATLSSLCTFYLQSGSDKTQVDFEEQIFEPMLRNENPSGDILLDELLARKNSGESTNFQYAPMLISCAYCAQSMKELERGNREFAWSYLAHARYWCGATNAGVGIEDARNQTIVATRKNTSQKGNAAKDKKRELMLAEVFRLAKEKRPAKKGWHSRPHVAEAIANDVLNYAKKIGYHFKGAKPDKTIICWLDEISNEDQVIPLKKIKIRASKR